MGTMGTTGTTSHSHGHHIQTNVLCVGPFGGNSVQARPMLCQACHQCCASAVGCPRPAPQSKGTKQPTNTSQTLSSPVSRLHDLIPFPLRWTAGSGTAPPDRSLLIALGVFVATSGPLRWARIHLLCVSSNRTLLSVLRPHLNPTSYCMHLYHTIA